MSHPTLLHRWFDEVWNQGRVETIYEAWNHFDFLSLYQQLGVKIP